LLLKLNDNRIGGSIRRLGESLK